MKDLSGDPADLYTGPPLWAFFPSEKEVEGVSGTEAVPTGDLWWDVGITFLELGGSIWHAENNWQMRRHWLHDFDKDAWKDLKANNGEKSFEKEAAEPEQIGYYDPKRKLLVVQRHHDTHHFDPKKNEWKKILTGDKDDGEIALRP